MWEQAKQAQKQAELQRKLQEMEKQAAIYQDRMMATAAPKYEEQENLTWEQEKQQMIEQKITMHAYEIQRLADDANRYKEHAKKAEQRFEERLEKLEQILKEENMLESSLVSEDKTLRAIAEAIVDKSN